MENLTKKIVAGIITLMFVLSCTNEEIVFQNDDDLILLREKTFKCDS